MQQLVQAALELIEVLVLGEVRPRAVVNVAADGQKMPAVGGGADEGSACDGLEEGFDDGEVVLAVVDDL